MSFDAGDLRAALAHLGRVLELRGERYQVAIVGGAALLLGAGSTGRPSTWTSWRCGATASW